MARDAFRTYACYKARAACSARPRLAIRAASDRVSNVTFDACAGYDTWLFYAGLRCTDQLFQLDLDFLVARLRFTPGRHARRRLLHRGAWAV